MHLIITDDHVSPLGFFLNFTPKDYVFSEDRKVNKVNSTLPSRSAVEAGRKSILPRLLLRRRNEIERKQTETLS